MWLLVLLLVTEHRERRAAAAALGPATLAQHLSVDRLSTHNAVAKITVFELLERIQDAPFVQDAGINEDVAALFLHPGLEESHCTVVESSCGHSFPPERN